MFIQSNFASFNPRQNTFATPLSVGRGHFRAPFDSSFFSTQARMFMLMQAMSDTLGGFQGCRPMPLNRSPRFGRVGGFGPFGPRSCFPGPSRPSRPASSPAPRTVSRPSPAPKPVAGASVKPLCQSNSVSCGQTSVAMAVNSLTGKSLTDRDINNRYGFGLLSALNGESRGSGYRWRDGGDFTPGKWSILQQKLNKDKTPVLIGLNGPEFSASGRGHIVTLLSVNGDQVRYADPADGKIKTTTRRSIERAPAHPDGKFLFYANRG